MRKRIIPWLLAIVLLGIAAHLFSQPRKGTLEWHKREYSAAANRLAENRLMDRVRRSVAWLTKRGPGQQIPREKDIAKVEEHRKALVQLGHLTEKQFALYYRAVDQVKLRLAGTVVKPPAVINGRCWIASDTIVATAPRRVIGHFAILPKQNAIVVTGAPDVIALCEEEIRKADVR